MLELNFQLSTSNFQRRMGRGEGEPRVSGKRHFKRRDAKNAEKSQILKF
jgi:hypothetical protein